ncbi:hypothetical protein BU17DRAFT_98221 [Hysterangium stoloniferum]|nr:hypothetical protein BU17DRAFT_98221 [Hysterangium stoloniferum]
MDAQDYPMQVSTEFLTTTMAAVRDSALQGVQVTWDLHMEQFETMQHQLLEAQQKNNIPQPKSMVNPRVVSTAGSRCFVSVPGTPSSSPTTSLHSLSNPSSQGTSSLLPSLSPPIITIAIFALFTHHLPPRIEAAPLPAFFVFSPPFLSAIDAAVSIHLNTAPAADPLPLPLASNSRPAVRLQASVEFLLV